MKPKLVDYQKIIKLKPIEEIPRIEYNYVKIICNLLGFILVVIGSYILYQRKLNKENNKTIYQEKIKNLVREIKYN